MNDRLSYFHIDWLSESDGIGKRVVLFLQGCPLNCVWCHSPHSQPKESPLLFSEELCIGCQKCMVSCPNRVHSFDGKTHLIDRVKCSKCGECIESCPQSSFFKPASALTLPTKSSEVDVLFDLIKPQLELLGDEGGITFSGGEPLYQYKPLTLLAKRCKEAGFHTTLETSGMVPIETVKTIEPYIDHWLIGLRLTTGMPGYENSRNEEHLKMLMNWFYTKDALLTIRIPAIPGYTDTPEYLARTIEMLNFQHIKSIEVLPQNPEGGHYYQAMGISHNLMYNKESALNAYHLITDFFKTN